MSETCELKAIITTSKGEINLHLFAEQAPMTVANFVNLCQRNYYDGLTFHRVLADFMIQGGCPYGSGTGGPGYNFADEFADDLHHDRPGILSMANAGPGTNGSQFFVTHVPTPWLDNHHTIFGAVIDDSDQEVVNNIAQGDTIETIAIEGDPASLLEQNKDTIAQWNNDIDKAFPHLAE
ncbi:MAG: peptidylprolyl isomerase [Deltaproteobacteria bacterium]|nr:peptidylprolyl isomerase [Deltaproteobacteria bacterium]